MNDPINPKHYKHLPAEAIDIIEAAIEGAPSNKVACLHWQTLKYLLRCWEKNGVEDLRKGKVYLDRLVDSFDEDPYDAIAEVYNSDYETGSDEPTASPQGMLPPSGCRWLKCGETLIDTDEFIRRDGYRDTIAIELVGEKVEVGNLFIRKIETSSEPLRFYREPTLADLANGPVCCEVRDWDSEQWKARQLIQIHESGPFRFLCKNESCDNPLNWNQCRIEVAE